MSISLIACLFLASTFSSLKASMHFDNSKTMITFRAKDISLVKEVDCDQRSLLTHLLHMASIMLITISAQKSPEIYFPKAKIVSTEARYAR